MPKDSILRAPARLFAAASILAMGLCAAAAFAQGTASPAVKDRQVQAFFNGIALDQQLAEQYSSPAAPAAQVAAPQQATAQRQPAAVAAVDVDVEEPLSADELKMQKLEADLDAAIAKDDAEAGTDERATIAEVPPSPAQTVMLVLASLALLAFAASVLTLAIRELRKDAKQRKRTYRRRVKRRDTSTPAHAS